MEKKKAFVVILTVMMTAVPSGQIYAEGLRVGELRSGMKEAKNRQRVWQFQTFDVILQSLFGTSLP